MSKLDELDKKVKCENCGMLCAKLYFRHRHKLCSARNTELEKDFVDELRFAIGYSGGASDSDIITCETTGGRQASMRFDVLSKSLVEIVRKILAQVRQDEREAMKKELDLKNQKPGDYSYANGNDMESFCRGYNACKEYVEWVIDGKPDLINELK